MLNLKISYIIILIIQYFLFFNCYQGKKCEGSQLYHRVMLVIGLVDRILSLRSETCLLWFVHGHAILGLVQDRHFLVFLQDKKFVQGQAFLGFVKDSFVVCSRLSLCLSLFYRTELGLFSGNNSISHDLHWFIPSLSLAATTIRSHIIVTKQNLT